MRKSKIFRLLIITVIVAALCLVLASCDKKTSDLALEAPNEPIKISTADDFKGLSNYLGNKYSKYTFELTNNIDLSGLDSWTPIGKDIADSFRGTIDGKGYTVSGMTFGSINTDDYAPVITELGSIGLFGYTFNASFKNLNISNLDISFISSNDYVHAGGLVGYAYGKTVFENISVTDVNVEAVTYCYADLRVDGKGLVINKKNNQRQYIGGLVGYAIGQPEMKNVDISNIYVNNLTDSVVPVFDDPEDEFKQTGMEFVGNFAATYSRDPYYPRDAFIGGVAGFAKGSKVAVDTVDVSNFTSNAYGISLIAGGVFGSLYDGDASNITCSDVNLNAYLAAKGMTGGIAGLLDLTTIDNVSAIDFIEKISFTGANEVDACSIGGIVGYVNNYSTVSEATVTDAKIYSLSNKESTGERNYPAVGGIAGTVRDSEVFDCLNITGGVFKNNGDDIDNDFTHTAGMVAVVYGNSYLDNCYSEFNAFSGTVVKSVNNMYVDADGHKVLRFCKENAPKIYVGIATREENGQLAVDILGEDSSVLATYYYANYAGDINDIESLVQNYYDAETKSLFYYNNGVKTTISVNGKSLTGYRELSGKYAYNNLSYKDGTSLEVYGADTLDGAVWTFGGFHGNLLTEIIV